MSELTTHLSPYLSPQLIDALATLNITSPSSLLSTPPLTLFHRLPPNTCTLRDLNTAIARVRRASAAPGVRADELLEAGRQEGEPEPVVTGEQELDAVLGGDLRGRVIEVAGDGGSGKTALAMHLVLRHLCAHPAARALWIDCVGDFVPEGVASLLDAHVGPGRESVMDRIHLRLAFDVRSAFDALARLHASLLAAGKDKDESQNESAEKEHESEKQVRIVVLDTIAAIIGPILTAVSSEGHATMTNLMRILRLLARHHRLAILVLNNGTSAIPRGTATTTRGTTMPTGSAPAPASTPVPFLPRGGRKPALGPSFAFLSDATVWLSRAPASIDLERSDETDDGADADDDEESRRRAEYADAEAHVAEVLRSKVSASGLRCRFWIRRGVIVSSGGSEGS